MYQGINYPVGRITTDVQFEAKSIEEELRDINNSGEPIKMTAKITYNDRKDGVLPQHDIRTDRFELAMLATDKIHATEAAKVHSIDFPTVEMTEETAKAMQKATGGEA